MSSAGATTAPGGSFGVVGRPQLGEKQTRELVDDARLTEEMREGLEADTFIIYGKASVEQYDEDNPPQKLEMKAFEENLDAFIEDGIISRRHKDIPVGDPLRSYELEEPSDVVVADEVLEFDAGDTLETGVRDDEELWIVADLRKDSEIARETRMGAMTGDLNGFSVTVFCKEWEETSKGQRVTAFDWHATTIGGDDHIKNEDSRFGVAEFKALFGDKFPGLSGKQAERAAIEILHELPATMSAEGDTDEKGFWDRVSEIASQKSEEADPENDPETGKAGEEQDETTDSSGEETKEFDEDDMVPDEDEFDEEGKASDVNAVLEQVKNEVGEEQADLLIEELADEEDEEEEPNSAAEAGELKAEEVIEAMKSAGFVTEDTLEEKSAEFVTEETLEEKMAGVVKSDEFGDRVGEKLDEALPEGEVASKGDVEEVMKAAEEVLKETVPQVAQDASEQTAEKMVTGETPDPSGGSAQDEVDYQDQIQQRFGTKGGN